MTHIFHISQHYCQLSVVCTEKCRQCKSSIL